MLVAKPAGVIGHGVVVLGVQHASVVHQMEVGVGNNKARRLHVGVRLIVGHHWQAKPLTTTKQIFIFGKKENISSC